VSAGHDEGRVGSSGADAPTDLPATERVGIVGAGKLGTALARAAVAADYEVAVASSGPTERIALSVDVLAPGAVASTVEDVVASADVIVLAVPAHRFRELPSDLFDGKILVDAMNYWPDTDGDDPELATANGGSSVVVQSHFPGARVVKSLNQLGYHELEEYSRAPRASDRIAVAAVGDDRLAVRTVMRLIDRLGFDPVDGGPLANGKLLEPDGSPYAETLSADALAKRLSAQRDRVHPAPPPPV
jgi:8-hydroxy-5-deazaflavin:NADPH oxidoreductase